MDNIETVNDMIEVPSNVYQGNINTDNHLVDQNGLLKSYDNITEIATLIYSLDCDIDNLKTRLRMGPIPRNSGIKEDCTKCLDGIGKLFFTLLMFTMFLYFNIIVPQFTLNVT
ncbi:hypothetical protein DFJ63DRAFT_314160 [Scheffersomyces coipomensis]|uniref:uncharacterized protein n=1 Tax=Scheffersomyces coipomensis TaxID=1788519 RepID=UPI00315CBF41